MSVVDDAPRHIAGGLSGVDRDGEDLTDRHLFELELRPNVVIRTMHAAEVELGVDANCGAIHRVIIRGGVPRRQEQARARRGTPCPHHHLSPPIDFSSIPMLAYGL